MRSVVATVLVTGALVGGSALAASAPAPPVASAPSLRAMKQAGPPGPFGGDWYSSIELRHHINTYYDQSGALKRQEPSLHTRLQLGAQFYDGTADLYATVGVYKQPQTQQVLQRRPEVALDLYPFRNNYVTLLQYSLVQLPYEDSIPDPDSEESFAPGTVVNVGFAPTVKWPFLVGGSGFELRAGVDGWTRLFSRKQYTSTYHRPDEGDDSRLELTDSGAPGSPSDPSAPIEDSALHYRSEAMVGAAVSPDFLGGFMADVSVRHHTRFEPVYTVKDGAVAYHYAADRYSYYKIRFSYAVSERVAIVNDFYDFFGGFFAEKRTGEDRRFRNIARITCKL